MEINILFFGQLADITGRSSSKMPLVKNTEELNQLLKKTYPKLQSVNYQIAVNREIIQSGTELHARDIIALLPPFSGG